MKLKRKKSLKIGPMPAHLRKAKAAISKKKEEKEALKGPSPKNESSKKTIDLIGEGYDALNEEVKAKEKELEKAKTTIKELAENSGEMDGKFKVLRGKKYEIGYVNADQEPDILLGPWNQLVAPSVRLLCEELTINRKDLEDVINRGLISPAVVKKILRPRPPQRRIHVKRIK